MGEEKASTFCSARLLRYSAAARRSHHRDPRASAHAEDDSHVGEDRDHADHGWSEVFDDAGNPYFHNVRTGETTWDKPDCMKATTHKPLAAKTKSKVPSEEPQV